MTSQDLTPLSHTIPNACRRLGISRTTLYELVRLGELKTIKIGGRTLVPESELQKAIVSRLQGGE